MAGKGVLMLLCVAAAIAAQDSAPKSRAGSRPALAELTLAHGIKARLVPLGFPGEVAILVAFDGAGILSEPRGSPHIAHVTEHVAFHGAGGPFTAKLFGEGRTNAETLPDIMYFDCFPTKEELPEALATAIARATGDFAVEDAVVQREKPRALAEVRQLEDSRLKNADYLGKFAWSPFVQTAAFGATDVPFVAATDAITAAAVKDFARSGRFRPDGATIVVMGDFDSAAVADMLKGMAATAKPEPVPPRPAPIALEPGAVTGTWDVRSRQFFMAFPLPPPSDPAHPALALVGQALGMQLMARATLSTIAMRPVLVHARVGGLFAVQMPLRADAKGEMAAAEVHLTLQSLAERAGTVAKAYRAQVRQGCGLGRIAYPPQLPRKILAHANQELMRLRTAIALGQDPEAYCDRVDAVTPEQITAAMTTWLAPSKATVVIINGKE